MKTVSHHRCEQAVRPLTHSDSCELGRHGHEPCAEQPGECMPARTTCDDSGLFPLDEPPMLRCHSISEEGGMYRAVKDTRVAF